MDVASVVETTGTVVDVAGVAVIVCGILVVTVVFARRLLRHRDVSTAYRLYRQGLGRVILLGLELLVAGDIIRTVAVKPTLMSVGVLAAIVLVRTFLSMSLQVELEGRWPWRRPAQPPPGRT